MPLLSPQVMMFKIRLFRHPILSGIYLLWVLVVLVRYSQDRFHCLLLDSMLILLAVHLPALFLLWLIFHLHLSGYLFRQINLPTLLLPTFPTPTCQFRLLCSNLRQRFSCPKSKHHELLIAENKALKAQIDLLKALGHSNSQFSAKDGTMSDTF
jgi:hypothetical protein